MASWYLILMCARKRQDATSLMNDGLLESNPHVRACVKMQDALSHLMNNGLLVSDPHVRAGVKMQSPT